MLVLKQNQPRTVRTWGPCGKPKEVVEHDDLYTYMDSYMPKRCKLYNYVYIYIRICIHGIIHVCIHDEFHYMYTQKYDLVSNINVTV